jgi:hypothetical protein
MYEEKICIYLRANFFGAKVPQKGAVAFSQSRPLEICPVGRKSQGLSGVVKCYCFLRHVFIAKRALVRLTFIGCATAIFNCGKRGNKILFLTPR